MNDVLTVEHVEKQFEGKSIFTDLNLHIQPQEFVSVIGKSGSGKSTLLRLISGLDQPAGGSILLDGAAINGINYNIRMMFQEERLLPWKNILKNLILGFGKEKEGEAQELLAQIGLTGYKDAYPHQLSGGQKQRVALARALLHKPSLLLLDEPMGALDAFTRREMQDMITDICKKFHITALLVTHDIEEAVYMSQRVMVLGNGKVQFDFPIDLPYPRNKTDQRLQTKVEEITETFSKSREE